MFCWQSLKTIAQPDAEPAQVPLGTSIVLFQLFLLKLLYISYLYLLLIVYKYTYLVYMSDFLFMHNKKKSQILDPRFQISDPRFCALPWNKQIIQRIWDSLTNGNTIAFVFFATFMPGQTKESKVARNTNDIVTFSNTLYYL